MFFVGVVTASINQDVKVMSYYVFFMPFCDVTLFCDCTFLGVYTFYITRTKRQNK